MEGVAEGGVGPGVRTVVYDSNPTDRWFMFLIENLTQWTFPFALLTIELILCTVVVAPLPALMRTSLLKGLRSLWSRFPRFRLVYKTIMLLVTFLFVDSVRRMYVVYMRMELQHLAGKNGAANDLSALYAAERNAYLCGFTVFLYLLLLRFESMLGDQTKLEEQVEYYQRNHPDPLAPSSEPREKKVYLKEQILEEKLEQKGWVRPPATTATVEVPVTNIDSLSAEERARLRTVKPTL